MNTLPSITNVTNDNRIASLADGPVQIVHAPPLMPTSAEYAQYLALAEQFIASGFLPKAIRTPAQALIVMLTGRELGLPPMLALRMIHVIDGKPGLSAELQLARFRQAGGRYRWLATTDRVAQIQVNAPGDPTDWAQTFSFTIQEAGTAQLLDKGNWQKYPAAMLRARVASLAIRAVAPEVSMGLYDPDEISMGLYDPAKVDTSDDPVDTSDDKVDTSDDPVDTSDDKVVTSDDPVLPLDKLMRGKGMSPLPLSDPACDLACCLVFIEAATISVESTKRWTPAIAKTWAALPAKIQEATEERLQKVRNWILKRETRTKVFHDWLERIEQQMEDLRHAENDAQILNEARSNMTRDEDAGTGGPDDQSIGIDDGGADDESVPLK
jgi:hypothetical protein